MGAVLALTTAAELPERVRRVVAVNTYDFRGGIADFAQVRAARGDRHGNLVFHRSAANFNPLAAMAGRTTIAEVEELLEPGAIDPDAVHLPGIYVDRVVGPVRAAGKGIEKRTVRTREERH
jgi:3-oxoacid CoA-transferase subunit A